MEDIDRWERDISFVLDNHETAHLAVQEIAKQSETSYDMYVSLKDFYYEAITTALREIPENSLGHALIQEFCLNLPTDVFDLLTSAYWHMYKEEA